MNVIYIIFAFVVALAFSNECHTRKDVSQKPESLLALQKGHYEGDMIPVRGSDITKYKIKEGGLYLTYL